MVYSRELGIEFWYEFDGHFNPMFNGELVPMVNRSSVLFDDFDMCMNTTTGTLDVQMFNNAIASHNIDQDISKLAGRQLELMTPLIDESLKPPLQSAFEDFGQGVLYDRAHDDKRTLRYPSDEPVIDSQTGNPMIFRIHTMDAPGSYKWWHAFIRANVSLGADMNKWLVIDKYLTLSYLIYSAVKPKQAYQFPDLEVPENHPQSPIGLGSPDIVNQYRSILSTTNFEELDRIFWN